MFGLRRLTYRVFGKIYKKNITELIVSTRDVYPPKGFIQLEKGFVAPEEFVAREDFLLNFKEDYLGYPVYHLRYKRGIKAKAPEVIEDEKRAIEALFEEAAVE